MDNLDYMGEFEVVCHGADGKEKWRDSVKNTIMNVGKMLMLDTTLQAAVTVVGPFMGLISAVSFTGAPVATDTMASHGSWTEAGGTNTPTYTAPRKTCAWNAATSPGSKTLSATLQFAFTNVTGAVVKGLFIVLGAGAVSTIDSTAGTLFAAGLFSGGDKTVANGDTINCSYTATLT